MNPSRREFVKGLVLAPMALTASKAAAGAETSRSRLTTFAYSDVKLLDGPVKRQYDKTHQFFLKLDDDRLLKVYRKRAGLPAPGEDMGGWYEADGLTPGCFGQYLSALARFGNATGDQATKAKVGRLVRGFAETMGPDGNPYAVELGTEVGKLRNPAYILDKHAVGLLDAARLAGPSLSRKQQTMSFLSWLDNLRWKRFGRFSWGFRRKIKSLPGGPSF